LGPGGLEDENVEDAVDWLEDGRVSSRCGSGEREEENGEDDVADWLEDSAGHPGGGPDTREANTKRGHVFQRATGLRRSASRSALKSCNGRKLCG
jgi:hypothetical protein